MKPISPKDIVIAKKAIMPDGVIKAFNETIAKNYSSGYSKFTFKEVAALIATYLEISTDDVYKNKYLDVEEIYRKEGWKVSTDQPAYNESYAATFTFRK